VRDGTIQSVDLDTTTQGFAVVTKLIPGDSVTFSSTGVDPGTGEVTVNVVGIASKNLDGGSPESVYLPIQIVDGGGP
jgi:hypothetical protein